MITINELFSGIGAQVAAFKRLNIPYEVIGISEIDNYAIQSYEAINGQVRNYGDITKVPYLDYADLWTYSFPCQDLSFAGKQKGITESTRSGLLLHVERLLEESVNRGNQPIYLLLENVKALVSKKFMPDFQRWLDKLEQLGYNNYWQVLNAKDYGIPQNRERVFVVSIRKDADFIGYKFPEKIPLEKHLKDMLEPVVDEKYYLSEDKVEKLTSQIKEKEVSNTIRCGGGGSLDGKHTWDIIVEPMAYDEQNGYVRKDGCVGTLTTDGSSPKHNNRVIEPKVVQVGSIVSTGNWDNLQIGRVYSPEGCSPTLNTCGGGSHEPKILEKGCKNAKNKTIRTLLRILWKEIREKKVWEQIGRFQYVSETEILRQGMYEKSFFKTRETTSNIFQRSYNSEKYKFIIIESNFLRDMWLSIKSRRSSQRWGLSEQQFREFTSFMQKLSFKTAQKKEKMCYLWETDESFRVLRETLSEIQEIWKSINIKSQNKYRIRKLTARKCWRLMGFTDEEFRCAKASGVSNSQLYKQAGNSIVVNVLECIFKNLIVGNY